MTKEVYNLGSTDEEVLFRLQNKLHICRDRYKPHLINLHKYTRKNKQMDKKVYWAGIE